MASLSENKFLPHSSRTWLVHPPFEPSLSTTLLQTLVTGLLSIFVFAMPTDLHPFHGLSVTLPVGILCTALGIFGVMERRTAVTLTAGAWYLVAFVIWSTFSFAWSRYPGVTIPKLIKYWEFLPITWVMTQYAWDQRIRVRLFDAYLAGCWLGVVGLVHNFAIGNDFYIPGANEEGIRYSFSTDPNFLALAFVIGVPIAFYRALSFHKRWQQVLITSYLPAAFLGVGLTGSRGALVALLAGILTFAVFINMRKRIALLIGVVAFVMLILVLPSSLTWRLSTTTDEISHGTLDGRRTLWDQAPTLVAEHPLLGLGAGAAEGVYGDAAHNTPLEILLEAGLVGLGLFYGAFAHSLYRVCRGRAKERTLLAVIAAMWMVGTLSISWDTHLITWFIFAMLLSVGSARHAPWRLTSPETSRS